MSRQALISLHLTGYGWMCFHVPVSMSTCVSECNQSNLSGHFSCCHCHILKWNVSGYWIRLQNKQNSCIILNKNFIYLCNKYKILQYKFLMKLTFLDLTAGKMDTHTVLSITQTCKPEVPSLAKTGKTLKALPNTLCIPCGFICGDISSSPASIVLVNLNIKVIVQLKVLKTESS